MRKSTIGAHSYCRQYICRGNMEKYEYLFLTE